MRTLLIASVPAVIAALYTYLESRGHELDSARSGDCALWLAAENAYDIVVLGPVIAGVHTLCAQLKGVLGRKTTIPVPVLMLGSTHTEPETVAAFASGADDYVSMHCAPAEVEARLAAHVRRACGAVCRQAALQVGPLTLNVDTYEVVRGGTRIDLTPTGFLLLETLMRASPRVVSRSELIRGLWGDRAPETDVLRVHVHALRQAIDGPFPDAMLRTVRRVGYQLCSGQPAGAEGVVAKSHA